jgi:hypothetical protein
MPQRERWLGGIEHLQRQVQHHGAVLADGVPHHGVISLVHPFAHDVNRSRFQTLKMRQLDRSGR